MTPVPEAQDEPRLSNDDAISALKDVERTLLGFLESVKRKRSWRPSEVAMTVADYNRRLKAVREAIADRRAKSLS